MSFFKNAAKKLWNDQFLRYLTLAVLLLWIVMIVLPAKEASGKGELHFFYHPSCPHCHEAAPFLEQLEKERNSTFQRHDTSRPEEVALLQQLAAEKGIARLGVPTIIIDGEFFIGFNEEIANRIEAALAGFETDVPEATHVSIPFIGEINPTTYSLPLLAILLGAVDGFNPCAMWVLVYLISVIATLNDKRRIWLLVGSFVFASGALYFLFMTAWLNAFLLIGYLRPVTLAIGVAALGMGIASLKSFFEMKGPLVCDVTDAQERKRTMRRIDALAVAPLTIATLLGIIALAFVVNSIEFACSAALPAVFTQVLALAALPWWQHYGLILLYVLFFMLDDLIIFGLAAFTINTSVGDRYAKLCKLVGGVLLALIGSVLVFAPQLLR